MATEHKTIWEHNFGLIELQILKQESTLTSRRHSRRAHSSDEEEDGVGDKLGPMQRPFLQWRGGKWIKRAANNLKREQGRVNQSLWSTLMITICVFQSILFPTFLGSSRLWHAVFKLYHLIICFNKHMTPHNDASTAWGNILYKP